MHPSTELLGQSSTKLSGKKIVLGITGSIAAVETVKLSHELIRHGASVFTVLTTAATDIINPEALKSASGNTPVTKLTGDLEHVSLCGQVKNKADLLLIAPCTANTISKIACGIDDSTVTTFATTAIGSDIPILLVPAMHNSMYNHPIVKENIKKLKDKRLGIEFIEPIKAENKYKLASVEEITSRVIRRLWKPGLIGQQVLVIAGATAEAIDDMRLLTNRSTGQTGVALAKEAFLRGADVKLWLGQSMVIPPDYINCERFQSVRELQERVMMIGNKTNKIEKGYGEFNFIIVCAAISDYTVPKTIKGKIPSGKDKLTLELIPTAKIIDIIRKKAPTGYIVGFKAEANLSEHELIQKAYKRMTDGKLNLMVANDLKDVTNDTNQISIIHPENKHIKVKGNKSYLAQRIFDEIILKSK